MIELRVKGIGFRYVLLALLGLSGVGVGLPISTAAAGPKASKAAFKRYIRGWMKWNVRRGKDSGALLEKLGRGWTSKACRKLRGNPRSKCKAWFGEIRGEILAEFPPKAPAGPSSASERPSSPARAPAPEEPAAASSSADAAEEAPALVSGATPDCPAVPTKAGFKKWVWEKILRDDAELLAKIDSIAAYVGARSKKSSPAQQQAYFRDMFADLPSRNSHPLSRKGKDVLKAMAKEAKFSRRGTDLTKRIRKALKSKKWMEKNLAKWEGKVKEYEAKVASTSNNWARGKAQRKLRTAQKKLQQWQRNLKKLVGKINAAQVKMNQSAGAICGVAGKYLAAYRRALAADIDEYKRWFVVSAEARKLFATDPGFLKYRAPAMKEPGAAAKARAIGLPKGISGRGKFGPELIPFFQAAKKKLAAMRKEGAPKVHFSATQYRGHSWSEYSADIWIYQKKVGPGADRVRYIPRDKLLAFFRALIHAGNKTGVVWRALYTDFEAAKIINAEAKKRVVRFQWIHGPGPYKDHIHLDMMPK